MTLDEVATALGSARGRVACVIRSCGATVRRGGATMERNGSWRGGRTTDADGYILVKTPGHPHANAAGYVREHRLVMEQMLGRFLLRSEVVHHMNGDPQDNRPENLELFESNAAHLAHELAGRRPNWTPEGRAAIQAEAERKKATAQGWTPEHRRQKNREYAAKYREKRQAMRQSSTRPTSESGAQA